MILYACILSPLLGQIAFWACPQDGLQQGHEGTLQCIPHEARCSQVLAVAGETVNKAADAAVTPQVPKNFVKPKQITSYGQYLKYAGQAAGILPIQPEADSPSAAPGPSAGTVTTNPFAKIPTCTVRLPLHPLM